MATRGPITYTTGSTLRAMVFNTSGRVRDVVANAWDAWADADRDDYDILCSELGTSGIYTFADPTGVTDVTSILTILQSKARA
jgi:hypothetical protein